MKTHTHLLVILLSFCVTYSQADDDVLNITSYFTSILDNNENLTDTQEVTYSTDGLLNYTELAEKYIGTCEEYEVTTEDGYILTIFHIPGNTSNTVLICPGLLSSPDVFLLRGNTSLVYMMAEQGFDVWAMSYRGTRYSRKHVTLNPDTDAAYWEFSMHEIGIYDYKAVIDFILEETSQEELSAVGHSEGTSAFYILTAERPEYNSKIKVFAALAPVCYLGNTGPGMTTLLLAGEALQPAVKDVGVEILGYNSTESKAVDIVCSQGVVGYAVCFIDVLGPSVGYNPTNLEPEFVPTILGHFPAGTSLKNLIHYVNVYQQDEFVKYDYGLENLSVYGSLTPPAYNLTNISTKIAMFVSNGDLLTRIADIERLRSVLPNVVYYQVLSDNNFTHLDYLWGLNADTVLYPYVIDILSTYS